jgi:hypothetical protein
MKKAIQTAVLLASVLVASLSCEAAEGGEVLWWMVGEDYKNITGTTTDGSGTTMTAGELGVTDARVRYQDGSGNTLGYLKLYGLDSNGKVFELEGAGGVEVPAMFFGNLSDLADDLTAYSFVLELGNWKEGNWVHTSMESEVASYNDLKTKMHITDWHETTPSYGTPWKPTTGYTVVPEPSSGLMLLVGGAFLMLRRRRRG